MKTVFILTKLIASTVLSWVMGSHYEISMVNTNSTPVRALQELRDFEASFKYPYSDTQEFKIKHGLDGDYFSFFKQLGAPHYYVVRCKKDYVVSKVIDGKSIKIRHKAGEIAAVVCLVLRDMVTRKGKATKAWYICDLKVNPTYQGEHIPLKISQHIAVGRFAECPRGYAICMNPPEGDPKAASIFKKHGPISGLKTQQLNLYTLTTEQRKAHEAAIEKSFLHHGYLQPHEHLTFKSTNGIKDYQIFDKDGNNAHPWNLVHMQKTAESSKEIPEGATHMLCAVEGTPLNADLKKILGKPSSTAQIVSYGMKDVDFNLLTSNQI